MNKIIGIISWLPDNAFRDVRLTKLTNLMKKCREIFVDVPFILIAQNYSLDEEALILKTAPNTTLVHVEEKLGITGARKYLRNVFLNSKYDYLIMLDDDCELFGDSNSGKLYLKQIDENPDRFYEFNKTLLKLFAIHKDLFEKVDYEDVSPEKGECFEDRVFVNKLRKLYSEKQYIFKKYTLNEKSISTKDVYSTWYVAQDLKEMLSNTEKKINNIKNE